MQATDSSSFGVDAGVCDICTYICVYIHQRCISIPSVYIYIYVYIHTRGRGRAVAVAVPWPWPWPSRGLWAVAEAVAMVETL